ncbi:MAG TPA: arginine deiminase family protein [Actinomycetota bacterium]|jgi:N-dimethylarginine dimethylaminohydrolase
MAEPNVRGSDVPTTPPLPAPYAARIQEMQERLRSGEFTLDGMPGYVPGEPPSIETWHHMDYLDISPRIWGREVGCNGIGTLREVALVEITPNERFELRDRDPAYFPRMGLAHEELDTGRMRDQSLEYQAALESAGVAVHRVAFPDPPVGAFGPLRGTWAANELFVIRGGSVIEKLAVSPFGFGRAEYLALWAWTQLGVPIQAAITGTGVAEGAAGVFLADDVYVVGRGIAFNQEGLDQLLPIIQRSSGLPPEAFHSVVFDCPGNIYFDPGAGTSHHTDMVIGPLDVDKVIVYAAGLTFPVWRWLKERGYQIVEVERDEQVRFAPANVTILEPGRVIMHAEATNAVAAVRKLGVDVIEVPYSEFLRTGGGLHCSTMFVERDRGPLSTDR